MEYGFATHVVFWIIGLIAAVGAVGTVFGLWSMGRQAYRKE